MIAAAVLLGLPLASIAQTVSDSDVIKKTRQLVKEIVERSFPELEGEKIEIKSFKSRTNYFKTQFSISRFLTFRKMKTIVLVNPEVFAQNAPDEGIRAILAHELGHALFYKERQRLQLLGLIRLASGKFTARFERQTDLTAIERGYGKGLLIYREWLYERVSGKSLERKKRHYFTPEEINLLIAAFEKDPKSAQKLKKNVPRNLDELKKAVE